jgi:hypothetical protein
MLVRPISVRLNVVVHTSCCAKTAAEQVRSPSRMMPAADCTFRLAQARIAA